MKFKTAIIGFSLFIYLFLSCMVKQDMNLKLDGSGNLELKVGLEQVFIDYLFDLAEATTEVESYEKFTVFDVFRIRESLSKQKGLKVGQIVSATRDVLLISLTYEDIKSLSESISSKNVQPLFKFENRAGKKEFHFHLDKNNWGDIKKLFAMLEDPIFENLEPRVNEEVSQEEYLDIIEFAMDEPGREAVLDSVIEVNMKVDGTIISHKGGTLKNGILKVQIPLIDILLLNKPVAYSVVFH